MSATSYRSMLLSLLVLAGCDRPDVPADAGRDAGDETADASMMDASMREDASASDASMSDGAMDDGATDDASVEPDATTNTCGDGVMGGDEECDEGEDNSDTLADACRTDCTLARCGDGVSDSAETCDGDDLGGSACADEGFVDGVLRCAATCDAYDTAMCSTCGDGAVNGADQCDGDDLGGRTCVDELGAGAIGALACATDCTVDASACTLCGNGVIDAGEACDGDLLGGASCPDEGTITCSASCTLDMSACTSCGDGTAEGAEACDGTDLRGQSCASRPGFMSGVLRCDAACAFDETMCSAVAPVTAAGQIVISEIMQDPTAFSDADGEWFEVHNPGAEPLELAGCLVTGGGGMSDRFTIDRSVIVPAGGYATFAVSSSVEGAPGFSPDYRWTTSFGLTNTSDTVAITCGGTPIDSVTYDGGPFFPRPTGASMNLSASALSASANDAGGSWCTATTPITGSTDLGTPGAANEICPSFSVDSCRLEAPTTVTADVGTSHAIDGRVVVDGITTLSTGNDPSPFVIGAVGFGPDGSDPATASGWTWIAASPRGGWVDTAEPGADEYRATIIAPGPAGTYDFAYRFSSDSGATWTYCDSGTAGSTDGYQVANAGAMTTSGESAPVLYFSEYVEGSSSNKALEIYNPGVAAVDLGASACEVRLYVNGGSSPMETRALTGSLAAGDVLVLCHASIATAARSSCDALIMGGVVNFNGDDAIELFCAGTTLDVFGRIGQDPGSAWTGGGVTTVNRTLRRQCGVTAGDANGSDAFDPSVEWREFPEDTFDGLGSPACAP